METQLERLAIEALKLTPSERAAFAQLLLESLDEDSELDGAWLIEVEQRIAQADNGTNPVLLLAETLARVRDTLK